MATARRRRLAMSAALIGTLALAAIAYAYWTATGSGSGSAVTSNPTQTVTVKQTSASTGLYPGGSVALSGNFDNPAANAVRVSSISATVTGTDKPGCDPNDYSISGTPTIAGGGDVPSGNGVGGWSGFTLSMANTATNQDACKGATVSISYTAS